MVRERVGPGPGSLNTRDSGYDPVVGLNEKGSSTLTTFAQAKRATEGKAAVHDAAPGQYDAPEPRPIHTKSRVAFNKKDKQYDFIKYGFFWTLA